LIITSAVIGFCGTVVYSFALIFLNHIYLRRRLAVPLQSSRASLVAIIFVTGCYFTLAAAYVWIKFA
jgi:hypothetical protein